MVSFYYGHQITVIYAYIIAMESIVSSGVLEGDLNAKMKMYNFHVNMMLMQFCKL